MIWLLLIGAGLVAETVIIVVLGRAVTARYDAGDRHSLRPDRTLLDRGTGLRPSSLDDGSRADAEGADASERAAPDHGAPALGPIGVAGVFFS